MSELAKRTIYYNTAIKKQQICLPH